MGSTSEGVQAGARDASGGVRAGDFEAGALFEALDRQRVERAISSRQVADAIWTQSCCSTIDATTTQSPSRRSLVCRGETTRLASMRCSCCAGSAEHRGVHRRSSTGQRGVWASLAGPDRRLRWNLRALYYAMDDRRRDEVLTWKSLAALLGCTQSQLTGIKTARFATGMRLAMRITQWLARPASEFVYAARW